MYIINWSYQTLHIWNQYWYKFISCFKFNYFKFQRWKSSVIEIHIKYFSIALQNKWNCKYCLYHDFLNAQLSFCTLILLKYWNPIFHVHFTVYCFTVGFLFFKGNFYIYQEYIRKKPLRYFAMFCMLMWVLFTYFSYYNFIYAARGY